MIEGIFLVEWDSIKENGTIYSNSNNNNDDSLVENPKIISCFPKDDVTLNNSAILNRLIKAHISEVKTVTNSKEKLIYSGKKSFQVQSIYDYTIYSCYLPLNRMVCLIFDKFDNPNDYSKEFEKSLDLFVFSDLGAFYNLSNTDLENTLVSVFVDIRSCCLTLIDESSFYIDQQELKNRVINQDKIIKVFLYGIDNAGKSSFTRYLKTGKYDHNYFIPTKKFVIHKIKLSSNVKLICWESPGQKAFRRVWLRGVQDSNLLIFMLDAADHERYAEAKRSFWSIITRYEVKNVPLLFIANKIDLIENERKLRKIESYFSLPEIKDRKLTIKFISLVSKEGIKDVIDWISTTVNENVMDELIDY